MPKPGKSETDCLMRKTIAFSLAALLVLFATASQAGKRPPKTQPIISPQSYSEFTYHNHVSNDFEDSKRFDLRNPISLRVRIHKLRVPRSGYVELLFTEVGEEIKRPADVPLDAPVARFRRATLQTVGEARRMNLRERDFREGVVANITGWPAFPRQMPFSEMLIDEISVEGSERAFTLHRESPKMVKFKDRHLLNQDRPPTNVKPQGPGA